MSRRPSPPSLRVDLGPERGYDLFFEPLAALPDRMHGADLTSTRCVIVTDDHVGPLYAGVIAGGLKKAGFDTHVITLPAGETTKSAALLARIYDAALGWGIERGTPLVALGGGVVGDLAGFAAATLLRGLPLVQVPTTLVAQVDSAIGGKTGINHPAGKNLIGAFYQPRFVLADPSVLQSLPEREWTSGLAEVVKHGLIADRPLFEDLERRWDAMRAREEAVVADLVRRAARVKTLVVAEDERENGRRAILNFGHTFAHAIERVAGYGTFTHGEAVAAGMRAALHLSGQIYDDLDDGRADRLVASIPVPKGLADLEVARLNDAVKTDKKVRDGQVRFVVLDRIGHALVTDAATPEAVDAAWAHAQDVAG